MGIEDTEKIDERAAEKVREFVKTIPMQEYSPYDFGLYLYAVRDQKRLEKYFGQRKYEVENWAVPGKVGWERAWFVSDKKDEMKELGPFQTFREAIDAIPEEE